MRGERDQVEAVPRASKLEHGKRRGVNEQIGQLLRNRSSNRYSNPISMSTGTFIQVYSRCNLPLSAHPASSTDIIAPVPTPPASHSKRLSVKSYPLANRSPYSRLAFECPIPSQLPDDVKIISSTGSNREAGQYHSMANKIMVAWTRTLSAISRSSGALRPVGSLETHEISPCLSSTIRTPSTDIPYSSRGPHREPLLDFSGALGPTLDSLILNVGNDTTPESATWETGRWTIVSGI